MRGLKNLIGGWIALTALACIILLTNEIAIGSTYVVYIPLDSPIYDQLDTLNAFGLLNTYLPEIKPISRVEAARLVLEAERKLAATEQSPQLPIVDATLRSLKLQLDEEIRWLNSNQEDNQPTMIHPLERFEGQYVFSHGQRRELHIKPDAGVNFEEATPLLPNNDNLPTSPGSNEVARWAGWAGFGGFVTAYGESAVAGPLTRAPSGQSGTDNGSRATLLTGAAVVSLGNTAISFGQEEMAWGTGHFAKLSQSNNARPFPALRLQKIHPTHLPGFLRYLGPFRWQLFFGQLDDDRYFSHPWIDGQILSFKPLPNFEFGLTHVIDFGGLHNDNYSLMGFLGRATGFATGNPNGANTHQRGGVYLRFRFPRLRNLELYQEIVGNDNLTKELPPIGRFLPFLAVSYQGGFYLPQLTADGMTDARFEYALLEPNDQIHSDSLYWTYNNTLMGDPMGPNASAVDFQIGRWLDLNDKLGADGFYTERAPSIGAFVPVGIHKERSGGAAIDLWRMPGISRGMPDLVTAMHARLAGEYVTHINYSDRSAFRLMLLLSFSVAPHHDSYAWR